MAEIAAKPKLLGSGGQADIFQISLGKIQGLDCH